MATLAIGSGFALIATAANDAPVSSSRVDSASSPFVMRPGVVVDPLAGRLYMMNPQGGIDAVEIASGKLIWRTMAAAKPLIAFQDRLLAQAEASRGASDLPLIVLDAKDGSRRATIGLPMPSGVMPTVANSLGTASSLSAAIVQGEAVIQWRFTQSHPSGVQPPPEPARTAAGAFAIDLRTFAVTTLDSQQAAAKVDGSHASAVAPSQLSSASNSYVKPQRAGDFYVGVALRSSASGISAILER